MGGIWYSDTARADFPAGPVARNNSTPALNRQLPTPFGFRALPREQSESASPTAASASIVLTETSRARRGRAKRSSTSAKNRSSSRTASATSGLWDRSDDDINDVPARTRSRKPAPESATLRSCPTSPAASRPPRLLRDGSNVISNWATADEQRLQNLC